MKKDDLLNELYNMYQDGRFEELGEVTGRVRFWCTAEDDFLNASSEAATKEREKLEKEIGDELKKREDAEEALEKVQWLIEALYGVGSPFFDEVWRSAETNFEAYTNERNHASLLHVKRGLVEIIEREDRIRGEKGIEKIGMPF